MINKFKKLIKKEIKSKSDEDLNKEIYNFAKNDILVLVPDFPSNEFKNINIEIYRRVKEYLKEGLKIDVVVANDYFIADTYSYQFDNINILRTGYNQVRNLLLKKKYKKILIHKPVLTYYKILNAVDIKDTQIILYSYGDDLNCDIKGVTDKYHIQENSDIESYNTRENFKFIFMNLKQKEIFEKVNNIKLNNVDIISDGKSDVKLIKEFNKVEKIEIPEMSNKPLLSISIASYNVSSFIIQILCNLLRSKYANKLEVLVINDGSKDNTVEVVEEFINKYYKGKNQSIIRMIDKPNGGHGSTINKGIELATGKYFRLLDGDDYYVINQLDKFMEFIENEDSDMIFTEYYEDFAVNGEYKKTDLYKKMIPGYQYKFDEICVPGNEKIDWGPLLHTTTYKTNLLQNLKFKIDEHCFYVDNEFNLMGTFVSNTVTFYPLYIYSYYLGRAGQSVSPESYKKNVKQLEKVCMRIIEEYNARKDSLSKEKQNYIEKHMVINLCYTMYWIVTELYKEKNPFIEFDDKLKKYPEYYNSEKIINKRIIALRKTKGNFMLLNKIK
jgi:glycosyltransferase involved in cell wall biosynthesis